GAWGSRRAAAAPGARGGRAVLTLAGGGPGRPAPPHHAELLGHLERGERLSAERAQRLGRSVVAVAQDDDRGEDLFLARVRQADDVRLLHGRMAEQDFLDLQRGDIDPAGLHHLLDPAAEAEPAIVAEGAEIAGDQKAVGV